MHGSHGASCSLSSLDLGLLHIAHLLDSMMDASDSLNTDLDKLHALIKSTMVYVGQLGCEADVLEAYLRSVERASPQRSVA